MSSPQPSRPQKLQKKNWTNQEGFLRVQQSGAVRGKNFGTNQKFLTFRQWARNCRFLGEVFLKELSPPHSICPEKSFETKVFLLKQVWHFFLIQNEEIPDLWPKFSTRMSKAKFTWPEEVFGKTLFGRLYNFKSFDGFCEENLLCKKTPGSTVRHFTRPVEHSKGQKSKETKPL